MAFDYVEAAEIVVAVVIVVLEVVVMIVVVVELNYDDPTFQMFHSIDLIVI